ncbi:MAG: twin-arginine translocase TatA/TatE family subunit [Phycisphaerales bacterium]|nr:MAG: twin-arginine translocase TatA/TatE family subunit [Phycisphaerales bacterium]
MIDAIVPENLTLAIFGLPGGGEWIILLVLGLLVFGRKLPDVGRGLGRSIVEFKKGIKGIEDDVEDASSKPREALPKDTAPQQLPKDSPAGDDTENPYRTAEESAPGDAG